MMVIDSVFINYFKINQYDENKKVSLDGVFMDTEDPK